MEMNREVILRWEDDSLSDHLALSVERNLHSISTSARCATNEVVIVRRGPASVTDVSRRYFAGISVGSCSSQHSETLRLINESHKC